MNTTYTRRILSCLVAFTALLGTQAIAQEAVRESLELYGARITDISSTPDGSTLFATAEGPYGIFYTTTFGSSWSLGLGGDYEAGSGKYVVANATNAYAILGNQLYKTEVATPTSWSEVSITGMMNPQTLTLVGNFLVIGANDGNIYVYDVANEALVDTESLPSGNINRVAISTASGHEFIYAEIGTGNTPTYHRNTFDNSTGDIGSAAWTTVTPSGVTSGKFAGLAVDPDGRVYVSTFNAGNSEDGVYRSSDDGATYTRILTPTNAADSAFNGMTYLVGGFISTDGGTTFTQLPTVTGETTPLHLSPNVVFLDPSDDTKAMRTADVGIAKTENFKDSPSTWSAANTGLEGVQVEEMAQFESNKDVVFLATNQQCALTNNFLSESPTWVHPILPGGDGSGCRGAALDVNDNTTIYAATSRLYKGTLDVSGSTPSVDSWQLIDDLTTETGRQFTNVTTVKTYSFLPTTLIAGYAQNEGGIDGKLIMYDLSDSFAETAPTELDGKPISAFEAISSTVFFVGVGVFQDTPDAANRGIYQSTDGGSTWSQMTDSDISSTENVSEFAYDSAQDILYAATDSNGVLKLETATSGTDWETTTALSMSNGAVTAIAVDPTTGTVYAAQGNNVYRSDDEGDTWTTYYSGLTDEQTAELFFDDLVQGSNTGFYALEDANDTEIASPLYTVWSGFLGMNNVLELVNKGNTTLTATVTLYDITGAVAGTQSGISIASKGQQDVLVNLIGGFTSNSYGIVKVEFSGSLDGRMAYYRNDASSTISGDDYEFAYAVPFTNSVSGVTNVGFNTNQPSLNPSDANFEVHNWLSIINLADATKTYVVTRYAQDGSVIGSDTVVVNSFGRFDIDGGHLNPGAGFVGFLKITPQDSSAQYLALLTRYGNSATGFDFAFPLIAKAGGGTEQWVSISSGGGAQNWVEVINTSASPEEITLTFYDNSSSNTPTTMTVNLGAYGQYHVEASALLPTNSSGAVRIASQNSGRLIAQSMYYFRESSGSINAMYGKQADLKSAGGVSGSYNLFLGMYNWFRVFNATASSQTFNLEVHGSGDTPTSISVTLGAYAGTDLGLHENSTYGTMENSYGAVNTTGSGLVSEVLRIKPDGNGNIDFAFPTENK